MSTKIAFHGSCSAAAAAAAAAAAVAAAGCVQRTARRQSGNTTLRRLQVKTNRRALAWPAISHMLAPRISQLLHAAASRCSRTAQLPRFLSTRSSSRPTRPASHATPSRISSSSVPYPHPNTNTSSSSSSSENLPPQLAQAWLSLGLPPPTLTVVADLNLRAPAPVQVL